MFKRKERKDSPKNISFYHYFRDYRITKTPEKDKLKIEEFYKENNVKHKGLTSYQQNIVFKRTINFIYIIGRFFNDESYAKNIAKLGPNKHFGVVRIQAYLFYKTGELLYELDHDFQTYPTGRNTTQTSKKKLLKISYDLHDKLDNPFLKEIGERSQNFIRFDRTCLELLKHDDSNSVDFIKEA